MRLVNSFARFVGSDRIKAIRGFADNAPDIQREQLRQILKHASDTLIGREYDFASIRNAQTFAERMPVRDYEAYSGYIDLMCRGEADVCWPGQVKWFAKSSGTTNAKSKFIPVTDDSLHTCHYRGAKDAIFVYIDNYPDSKMLTGKCLTLGGSKQLSPFNGSSVTGDLSAILIGNAPSLSSFIKTPQPEVALLANWEEKLEQITKTTAVEHVTSLAGVPSWFLILLRHMMKKLGATSLRDIWPDLELFMHGGVCFAPYREQFDVLAGGKMHYMEMYNASEGFFGMQTSRVNDGIELMLDYGVYYEFVPLSELANECPSAVGIQDVEMGCDYAVVISTNGGLWRYLIGDTVRFVSLRPYKVIISGRTKHFINAFGEELMVDNAERALRAACEATGAMLRDYTAAPVFMVGDAQGCHEWLVEFEREPSSLDVFARVLDEALQGVNSDYEAKRCGNVTLAMPRITVARDGLFYDWLKSKGKLGGQNKVPRLANNRDYIDSLLKMNN